MHIDPKLRQRVSALLMRSSRESQQPDNAPPSDTELLQLSEGALSPDRRREIMAHLARDGELTHRWVQLQQDWELVNTPRVQKTSPRPRPTWTWLLSGATAAVLAVAVIWPYGSRDAFTDLETLSWPATASALSWPLNSKALGPGVSDEHLRVAFAAGVVKVLEQAPAEGDWADLKQWYAERAKGVDCPQHCDDEQHDAWRLGYWASWVRLACLSKEALSPADQTLLIEARRTLSIPADLLIDPPAEAAQPQSIQAYCAESAQLFSYYE